MPLNLNTPAIKQQLDKMAAEPPTPAVDVTVTDVDGGTVRAEGSATGSWYSVSAWYQWAKDKGRSYGARIGLTW